jgi:hypothetical protein
MSNDVVSSREEAARATNRIMELQQNFYQVSVENEQLKQEEFNLREHLREAQEILEALQSQTVSKADKVNLEAIVSQLQHNLNESQSVENALKEQLDRLAKDNDLLGQQNISLSSKVGSVVQQMEKIEQEHATRNHIQSLLNQKMISIEKLELEFNEIQGKAVLTKPLISPSYPKIYTCKMDSLPFQVTKRLSNSVCIMWTV